MKENPLLKAQAFGLSIWMDYLSRQVIASGALSRLVNEDGLSGVTSNPAIFGKAIGGGNDYDDVIHTLARKGRRQRAVATTRCVETKDRGFLWGTGCMQEGVGDCGNGPIRQRLGVARAGRRQAQ